MPKAPRSQEEVEAIREEILEAALELIITEGFSNLSMRKIAARLGITATTIYNYVASKDELNLFIRMKGFEILYQGLRAGLEAYDNLSDRLTAMVRAYADFGINFPSYYDIMFSLSTPKYTDYIGTDIEATARLEKETSMRCFTIFHNLITAYSTEMNFTVDREYISYLVTTMWSDLHGIISLYNSRVLYEVNEASREILFRRVDDLVASVTTLKQQIESGTAQKK